MWLVSVSCRYCCGAVIGTGLALVKGMNDGTKTWEGVMTDKVEIEFVVDVDLLGSLATEADVENHVDALESIETDDVVLVDDGAVFYNKIVVTARAANSGFSEDRIWVNGTEVFPGEGDYDDLQGVRDEIWEQALLCQERVTT